MKYAFFDIETDGLLKELSRLWCVTVKVDGKMELYDPSGSSHGGPEDGIRRLLELVISGHILVGHNILDFDLPALTKLSEYKTFIELKYPEVIDTLAMARVIYTSLRESDVGLVARGTLPRNLIGSHSLKAWGHRLGNHKMDFETDWQSWTPEMSVYAQQDVEVTEDLFNRLMSKGLSPKCMEIEQLTAHVIARQERRGFHFDIDRAEQLYVHLAEAQGKLDAALKEAFQPVVFPVGGVKIPTRKHTRLGYDKGTPYQRIKIEEFNAGSARHVYMNLKIKYGWEPKEFTPASNEPVVNEEVLSGLPYPEAQLLLDSMCISKLMGMLGDGSKAWLKLVDQEDGAIHGRVNSNGAVTGRMTHYSPNITQVPKVLHGPEGILMGLKGRYGYESRSLFKARPRYKLVGCDASGLELRCLAHYLAPYDDGEYIKVVTTGDVHTVNQKAAGLSSRDQAKTMIYAYNYGSGDALLGNIVGGGRKEGKKLRESLERNIPALGQLRDNLKKVVAERKRAHGVCHLKGIDGRLLYVRADYRALNTLLQSMGAVVCKLALVRLDEYLQAPYGLTPGVEYEFVSNNHDEFQMEVIDKDGLPEIVGEAAREAFCKAGVELGIKCPLDGEFKIGNNWADTH